MNGYKEILKTQSISALARTYLFVAAACTRRNNILRYYIAAHSQQMKNCHNCEMLCGCGADRPFFFLYVMPKALIICAKRTEPIRLRGPQCRITGSVPSNKQSILLI